MCTEMYFTEIINFSLLYIVSGSTKNCSLSIFTVAKTSHISLIFTHHNSKVYFKNPYVLYNCTI